MHTLSMVLGVLLCSIVIVGAIITLVGTINLCKHDWQMISEVTTKSKYELIGESTGNVPGLSNWSQLSPITDRKFIQTLRCSKCGKLKRFVENI